MCAPASQAKWTEIYKDNASARLLYEANSENKTLRLLSGVYVKKSMGRGAVSGMIRSNGWVHLETRPVHQKMYAALCQAWVFCCDWLAWWPPLCIDA